jgi:hypothetical protein
VVLGTITIEAAQQKAAALGYSAVDVQLLVDNLVAERKLDAERQAARDRVAAALAPVGVDLGAIEQRVISGNATLAEYRADLANRGLTSDDVDALSAWVETRRADARASEAFGATVGQELERKQLSLSQWEAAVKEQLRSYADYAAFLQQQGYDLADVQVLTTLLARKLEKATAPKA